MLNKISLIPFCFSLFSSLSLDILSVEAVLFDAISFRSISFHLIPFQGILFHSDFIFSMLFLFQDHSAFSHHFYAFLRPSDQYILFIFAAIYIILSNLKCTSKSACRQRFLRKQKIHILLSYSLYKGGKYYV